MSHKIGTVMFLSLALFIQGAWAAPSPQALSTSKNLKGFITDQLCGEMDPFEVGDACLYLLETNDFIYKTEDGKLAVKQGSKKREIMLWADFDTPIKGLGDENSYLYLTDYVEINPRDLRFVENGDAREIIQSTFGASSASAFVVSLEVESEVKVASGKPDYQKFSCADKARIEAMRKHKSEYEITFETGLNCQAAEQVTLSDEDAKKEGTKTAYKVDCSDEVDGVYWLVAVKNDEENCKVLNVRERELSDY